MRHMKTTDAYQRASGPMSWPKRAGVLLVAEVGWFLLLHPLVPSTLAGFAVEFVTGLAVIALVYGGVRSIVWLQGRPISRMLNTAASLTIALGIGIVIFLGAYWCRTFLASNFTYMH
jgi:hypothetical protein